MPDFGGKLNNVAVGVTSLKDGDHEGGWRVVVDLAARDALLTGTDAAVEGMRVLVLSDGVEYQLDAGLATWSPVLDVGENNVWRVVDDVAARNAIAGSLRVRGMCVYVNSTGEVFALLTPTNPNPPQAELDNNANWARVYTFAGAGFSVRGAGASSEAFGASAAAAGANSVAVGNAASAAGAETVAVGQSASAAALNATVVGRLAGAAVGATNSVVVGRATSASADGNVAVGAGATATPGAAVAVGASAVAGGAGSNVAIGRIAFAAGSDVVIGASANDSHGGCIVLGRSAASTVAGQFVAGSDAAPITGVFFGRGVRSATPAAYAIIGTGGNAAGINGADVTLAGGVGGAAANSGGGVNLSTASPGAGTSLVTRARVDPDGTLDVRFGRKLKRTATGSGVYVVLVTDYLIAVTSTGTPRTVTLPNAVGNSGREYVVKDEGGNAGTNNVTVNTAGGNIDGAATNVIAANFGSRRFYSNGTDWFTF